MPCPGFRDARFAAPAMAMTIAMALGCPADDADGETDPSTAATTNASGDATGSGTDSGGPADGSSTDPSDTGPDPDGDATSGEPNLCGSYCNTVVACGEPPQTCVAACEARLRFRDDHFGPDCLAATEASLSCVAELSCAQIEAFACEMTQIAEVTTCEGDTDPGPEVVAFCEAQGECDVPASVCELAILDDFMQAAYGFGCESEYAALLACVTPVGCNATDPEIEAACGSESDALDAACPDLFG